MNIKGSLQKIISKPKLIFLFIKFLVCRVKIKAIGNKRKAALLLTKTNVHERTLKEICILFDLNNLDIYTKIDSIKIKKGFKLFKWHDNFFLLLPLLKSNFTYIFTDNEETTSLNSKVIYFNFNLYDDRSFHKGRKFQELKVPFFMHPQIYVQYKHHLDLDRFRTKNRKVKVLFAGNVDEGYKSEIIVKKFSLLDRYSIFKHAMNEFKEHVWIINSYKNLWEFFNLDSFVNKIVIINTGNVRIDQRTWLECLSQSYFFISPPGVFHPLSHNLIESLATNTIPITNCHHFLPDKLSNSNESLKFDSFEELDNAFNNALNINFEKILRYQENVENYFKKIIEKKQFFNRAVNFPAPLLKFWNREVKWNENLT